MNLHNKLRILVSLFYQEKVIAICTSTSYHASTPQFQEYIKDMN